MSKYHASPFGLDFLTQDDILKFHPFACKIHYVFVFNSWIVFHNFLFPLFSWGISRLFPVSSSSNSGWLILLFFLWVSNPTRSFCSFSKSSIGDPLLSPMVGCEHLHFYWPGSGRVSQETAISESCNQALLSIRNSIWVWCLHVGCIPRWGSLWMAFPLVSVPLFVPVFPLDRNNSELKFWRWVGGPIPQLGAVPNCWIWSLQVLSPICWVHQLISSPWKF